MDKELAQSIAQSTPPLNPRLANGLAMEQVNERMQDYYHTVFCSAFRSGAKNAIPGLEYIGPVRATPQQEYARHTLKRKNNKRNFDVARSDLYMVGYKFRYQGVDLPIRWISLPFVNDGGYMFQRGSQFVVSPVLNDIVFSITKNTIFVRLLRDRIIFERTPHTFRVNDMRNEMVQVVWATIHRKDKASPLIKAKHSMMHYLLAKYGFSEAWQRFAGFVPVTGYDEINAKNYPPEQWAICSSTKKKPNRYGKVAWRPSNLRLAIPVEHMAHPMVRAMVAGFYYIVDHFPDRTKKEWLDSPRLWRILLGVLIYPPGTSEGILHDSIDEHISSLDDYMDSFVIKQLKSLNYNIENIYELMALLMEHFSDWLTRSDERVNSVYDKELNILYFLGLEVTKGIFYTVYALNQRLSTRKQLTEKDVNEIFDRNLKSSLSFRYARQSCVSTMTISNDNKALRLTTIAVPQSSNSGARNAKLKLDDPSIRLHISVAEVCGYTYLTKPQPDGRGRLNHRVQIDENYRILRNPELRELLDATQQQIKS